MTTREHLEETEFMLLAALEELQWAEELAKAPYDDTIMVIADNVKLQKQRVTNLIRELKP